MRKKIVVLGSNIAGITAAIGAQHVLEGDGDVTVVSPSDQSVFDSSLIWLPFGRHGHVNLP